MTHKPTKEPLTCYRCQRPATSDEHVPPKCLFPERRDTGGDYRRNLITVPSCDEHNMGKSQDDEFLMAALTGIVGNAGVAYTQLRTKLARALGRTHGALLDAVMSDREDLIAVAPNGTAMHVLRGHPDMRRLIGCLENVARGIYYHEHGTRFVGRCCVLPMFVEFGQDREGRAIEMRKQIARPLWEQELRNVAPRGQILMSSRTDWVLPTNMAYRRCSLPSSGSRRHTCRCSLTGSHYQMSS